jgi:predicted RNA-binding protein YlxR (DUF448 family)
MPGRTLAHMNLGQHMDLAHMDVALMNHAPTDHDELDAGPRKTAPGAERFCAATGTVRPVTDMIRFVVSPDGMAVADLKRRLPGRGIWVTATRQALRTAIARKVFGRGFKRDVKLAPDMVEATERLMEQGALAALAIAHKARKVAIGFAKAEQALNRVRIVALIHAADAAPDGARKLDAALRRRLDLDAGRIAAINTFTSAQLDLALGRSNVIHAALLAGRESDTFMARAELLDRFRTGGLGDRNEPKPPETIEKQGRNG